MADLNIEYDLKHNLPQLHKALLTASCLSCPNDPVQFLKNTLVVFQGNDNLQGVDWQKFFIDSEHLAAKYFLAGKAVDADYMEIDNEVSPDLFVKAYSCYRNKLLSFCFRKWKSLTVQRNSNTTKPNPEMDVRHSQRVTLNKWLNWVKLHKRRKDVAIKKLEKLVLKRIFTAWFHVAKNSKRTKKYFQRLEASRIKSDTQDHLSRERCDGILMLPSNLYLKIFRYLEFSDWLNCSEVCSTWKSIIQSGTLWSQINFSGRKNWITDSTAKQILQSYRPFVIHLNLRGCTSLTWHSIKCVCECRNLQELNLSECINITDEMLQRIVEGCSYLLYLNLSCTLVTNTTLKELSRNCLNLQHLSVAYCYKLTDKGFFYLSLGKGCRSLIHLNLSGCTQMTIHGFRYISAGCPSIKELVINDMPTLSDSCVLALLSRCWHLAAVSLLNAPNLTDVAFKSIVEGSKLVSFCTEGNNQLTDASWTALCSSSPRLNRIHAADCPRMTDAALKSVRTLRNLQYLDISLCSRVSDVGIQYLTKGGSASKLRELNVSQCVLITDMSVKRIARRLRKLFHLNLSFCEKLSDLALESLSGSSIGSLDITGCKIQDLGLSNLAGICLKKLVLTGCVYVTDSGIENLCKNVRELEHVDISHCSALSDPAVRAFSFYCRGLVTLRMSGCFKMTDLAVHYLTSGSPYLRELDVSACVLLTDRATKHLEKICPPLHSIIMMHCRSISRAAALTLQPRVTHWEYSGDDPPLSFGYSLVKIQLSEKN